jgi:molybdenum cofactor synthesis domain-containing protein
MSCPSACVLIIGNEILSGRTQDANLGFLGRRCDELGIRLLEARVIPDDAPAIVAHVNECRQRFTYVFTTGGIGPTHDDITAATVAQAFGVPLRRNAEAVEALERFYEPGMLNEARLRMADIPEGARLIPNPVSGAPGFQLGNVFVLPGVPSILQAMFEGIVDRLAGGPPMLTVTVTTDVLEGAMAADLGAIQQRFPQVSIGSYPYFRHGALGVNLVLRGTDAAALDAARAAIGDMIARLGGRMLRPPMPVAG